MILQIVYKLQNLMEEHLLPKNKEDINKYRSRLNLSMDEYSDKEVWEIVKNTKWLAKLYVNQYKHLSPKEILKKMNMEYNINADNKQKDTLRS